MAETIRPEHVHLFVMLTGSCDPVLTIGRRLVEEVDFARAASVEEQVQIAAPGHVEQRRVRTSPSRRSRAQGTLVDVRLQNGAGDGP